MQIRIYRNPVISYLLPRHFLEDVERISRRYVEVKGTSDYLRWFQSWYLCARAFTMYYARTEEDGYEAWERVHKKVWDSGWPEYELLTIGDHRFHMVHSSVREKGKNPSYGSMLSARLSKKIQDRSKGNIFVLAALDIPYVDIVGWLPKAELGKCLSRGAYYLKEPDLKPMAECPGLSRRDNKRWYV